MYDNHTAPWLQDWTKGVEDAAKLSNARADHMMAPHIMQATAATKSPKQDGS